MQHEQLCEARFKTDEDYEFSLSARGRTLADVALKKTHYAGPAPVDLTEYNRAVSAQGIGARITAGHLRFALNDLVVPEQVIRDLGAALVTGGTILLYGPTGNGKTSIAERIHRVFADVVYIPWAVVVAGQILSVYDPLVHRAVARARRSGIPRWVLCNRPMVKVGGEMRSEMLEPRIDEATRICVAPLQMKANNGILLIDDFGRQRITPRELLNRWIVPLDRHTMFYPSGPDSASRFHFRCLSSFRRISLSADLAEDAFLRRFENKIRIEHFSEELFDELLRRICAAKRLELFSRDGTILAAGVSPLQPRRSAPMFPGGHYANYLRSGKV